MEEEKEEINISYKQVEWAIIPLLKNKDFKSLKKYSADFEDDDYRIRIFDKDKNLIATSKIDETEKMLDPNSNIFKNQKGILEKYRHMLKDKKNRIIKRT